MLGSVRGALSNERPYRDTVQWFRMPTLLPKRKATRSRAPARAPGRSGVVRDPGMHAPGTGTGRSPARPQALGPSGPHREGEEPSPMMHGREKSDLAIGAAKPANNNGRPSAELVEQRAGAEGNAGQDRTRRAQDRASVSQGLDRVRHVSPSHTQGGSRVPELGPLGSVRGALSNERPYRDLVAESCRRTNILG